MPFPAPVIFVRPWSTRVWIFLEDDFWYVSRNSVLLGLTVDTCLVLVYEAFWLPHCRNCGFYAVAVHRRSSTFPSFRRGSSSWSRPFSRPQSFPSCCSMVDVPVLRACRFSGAAVEMSLALPQLQLAEKSDSSNDPSYLTVTCSVFAWGVQDLDFLGDVFRNFSCIQHFLVRQWIHVGFSLRGF